IEVHPLLGRNIPLPSDPATNIWWGLDLLFGRKYEVFFLWWVGGYSFRIGFEFPCDISLRSISLNDEHVVGQFYVEGCQRRFPVEWSIGAIEFLANVCKHPVLYSSGDCVFEAFGIKQPWEPGRCEECVPNSFGVPFFECRRPVPIKKAGAHRVFNVAILTKAIQYQFHEGISRTRMHQTQINCLPTVVFS